MIWNIQDTNINWDQSVDKINALLIDKAKKFGISRDIYGSKLENIIQEVIEACKPCGSNLKCEHHKLEKGNSINDTMIEKKNKDKENR